MADARREMFGHLAKIAGVLASASRIELLDLLIHGERSVEALARASQLTVANVSQHLQHLRGAGIVAARRSGRQSYYRLADERILDLIASLRTIAEDNVAAATKTLRRFYLERDELSPVSREEMVARLREGKIILIDVRPDIEFQAAHIPGALSIPVTNLPGRLGELPRRQEIVAYCRGPYCVMAYKAMEILRPGGYHARRLDGGFAEWRRAGFPVMADIPAGP